MARLAALPLLRDLSLTTNGLLLAEHAAALRSAGLRRVNVSLDTLDPATFRRLTRRSGLDAVLAGLAEARRCGLDPIKVNAVVIRGVNDHEIPDLVSFCRDRGFPLRFIEVMDAGNANGWRPDLLVPAEEILGRIRERFQLRPAGRAEPDAPAVAYRIEGGGEVGVIASVTEPFCGECTRARLTADGRLVTCLFAEGGTDLRGPLRAGADDEELARLLHGAWSARRDRFSEERAEALRAGAPYDPHARRKFEMIALGG